jgi:putative nucleotidyltransferase with HDIG domain
MFGPSKHHVPAGSYHISNAEPLILQAFLGTCVGVTMYDAKNGVGGLMHLLLPEPIATEGSLFPDKYATTGLPRFIRALCEAGASKENLKACIAGGALVGPLDERDLALDIGGRSVDITQRLLSKENIQIEKSETGGFFACRLSLNMQTGENQIDPAGLDRFSEHETTSVSLPTQTQIHQAMDKLKPIPQVALKILRLVGEDTYDIQEIASEVRKDQVISAKTLQLCNSALFSFRQKIETLDHALLLIGQDQLIKMVISAAVKKLFEPGSQGYSLCKGGLYHHALGTALICEKLAQITGQMPPAVAYTAGLLHDIGKVVLDQYVSSAYPLFYRNIIEDHKNFIEAEKNILGLDHTEVGYDLAIKWDFPESLASTIKYHHNPQQDTENPEMTHTLFLADLLMSRFHAGLEIEQLDASQLSEKLKPMGLTIDRLPHIIDEIPKEIFSSSPDMFSEGCSLP